MDKAFSRSMPEGLRKVQNEYSNVKKVIGIISGKGGVGKSTTAINLADALKHFGFKVLFIDLDLYLWIKVLAVFDSIGSYLVGNSDGAIVFEFKLHI